VAAQTLQSIGDRIGDAKTVLPWLLAAAGGQVNGLATVASGAVAVSVGAAIRRYGGEEANLQALAAAALVWVGATVAWLWCAARAEHLLPVHDVQCTGGHTVCDQLSLTLRLNLSEGPQAVARREDRA
jgi:hypothetical protein